MRVSSIPVKRLLSETSTTPPRNRKVASDPLSFVPEVPKCTRTDTCFTYPKDGDSEDDKPLTKTARASTSVSAKQEPESSSEEDIPLASTNGVSKPPTVDESDLSEDEKPLAKTTRRAASRNSTVKSEKTGSSDLSDQEAEESSDEDVPLAKKTKKAAVPKKAPAKKKAAEPKKGRGKAKKEESDSEEEKPLRKGKAAPKAEVKDEKPKGRKKKSEA